MTAPIELAPRPRTRRGAIRVQVALAVTIVAVVIAQVYLIGAYIFGAGTGALDAHRSLGFAGHAVEVLVFVAALFAGRDRWLSFALAVVGTIQITLAGGHEWVGGLHPLFAMIVLALATMIAWRGWASR